MSIKKKIKDEVTRRMFEDYKEDNFGLEWTAEVAQGVCAGIVAFIDAMPDEKRKAFPARYRVGGQEMEVGIVERCDDNTIGSCSLAGGFIEIAERYGKDSFRSATSKKNTFYHELVYSILRTMGETELNDNEKFVCCFAGFLTEAMDAAVFIEDE